MANYTWPEPGWAGEGYKEDREGEEGKERGRKDGGDESQEEKEGGEN